MGSYTTNSFMRRVSASYGYISINKDSKGEISKYATDYMRHKAALSLDMRFLRRLSLVLTASVYDRDGNYANVGGEIVGYKPYFLLDGRLSWEKSKVRISLDATNITSTKYFDYGGLMMPKSWISAGVVITI